MAWTKWYTPRVVERIETNEIDFTDGDGLLDRPEGLTAVAPLYGLGTSAQDSGVTRYGSNALLFRDFGFLGGTVLGIRVRTDIVRLGRVVDRTVQLYNLGLIGANRASKIYDQIQEYGGENDTWEVTAVDLSNPLFGVVIDLAPHPNYPSSTVPIIRSVNIQFNLE